MFQRLLLILKVLMLLSGGKSNSYSQSICMHFMQLLYQQERNLPAWTMFRDNVNMFNEEQGEISFSVLGRAVTGSGNRKDIDVMREQWLRIQQYREFDEAMEQEYAKNGASEQNWRKSYNPYDPEVNATSEFMLARLRQLGQSSYEVYSNTTVSQTKAEADKTMVPFTRSTPIWKDDTSAYLDTQLDKCIKFTSAWAANFGHIWSAFAPPGMAEVDEPEALLVEREDADGDGAEHMHEESAAEEQPEAAPVAKKSKKRSASHGSGSKAKARKVAENPDSPRSPSPEPRPRQRKGPSPKVPVRMLKKFTQKPPPKEKSEDNRTWSEWGTVCEKSIIAGPRKNKGVRVFDRREFVLQDPWDHEDFVVGFSEDTEDDVDDEEKSDGE